MDPSCSCCCAANATTQRMPQYPLPPLKDLVLQACLLERVLHTTNRPFHLLGGFIVATANIGSLSKSGCLPRSCWYLSPDIDSIAPLSKMVLASSKCRNQFMKLLPDLIQTHRFPLFEHCLDSPQCHFFCLTSTFRSHLNLLQGRHCLFQFRQSL